VAVETPAFFATSRMFTCGRESATFLRPTYSECYFLIEALHRSQLHLRWLETQSL
jgi:hypothetical protein